VAKNATQYFPNITECHLLGYFKHTPPVYKPIFAEFRERAPVRLTEHASGSGDWLSCDGRSCGGCVKS